MTENIDASPEAVRMTGRAFLIAGCVIGAFLVLGHSHLAGWRGWDWGAGFGTQMWRWFVGAGLGLWVTSSLAPGFMRPVHIGWMLVAHAWGWLTTRLILCAFFYVILTPIGVVMRLLGKDLLDERREPAAASYWKRKTRVPDPRSMERQF